jgi:hypothetical protein
MPAFNVVLLILAKQNDLTADKLLKYFKSKNIKCIKSDNTEKFTITVIANRKSSFKSGIIYRNKYPITSILNRGINFNSQINSFESSEVFAAWWSCLACFKGKVINRPSRIGFIPFTDVNLITNEVKQLQLPPLAYSSDIKFLSSDKGSVINIHSLNNYNFLGRLSDQTSLQKDDVYVFTNFTPEKVVFLLIAGNDIYELSTPDGELKTLPKKITQQLKRALLRYNANFHLVVLEKNNHIYSLVHTSPFPTYHQYKHLEIKIHFSLYKYLYQ